MQHINVINMYSYGILYAQFAQMSRNKHCQQIHKALYSVFIIIIYNNTYLVYESFCAYYTWK